LIKISATHNHKSVDVFESSIFYS